MFCALTAIVALTVAACSSTSGTRATPTTTTTPAVATVHFSRHGYGLALNHPAAWRETTYIGFPEAVSTMSTTIVYLANAKLQNPCTRTFSSDRKQEGISCGLPMKTLPPGGVLVT
jgi:hypothetical protein